MTLRVKNTPRLTSRVVVGPECEASTAGCVKMPSRCVGSRSMKAGVAAPACRRGKPPALETNDCVDSVMSFIFGRRARKLALEEASWSRRPPPRRPPG